MRGSTIAAQKKTRRALAWTAGTLVTLFALAWLIDGSIAARAEYHASTIIEDNGPLRGVDLATPRVNIGGFPYTWAFVSGRVGHVSIDSLDATLPGLGLVSANVSLEGVTVTPKEVLSGDLRGENAEIVTHTIALDSVTLGALLGMPDLAIAHPYDISPGSTSSAEAELTGTPPGMDKPLSVLVKLRISDDHLVGQPVVLLDNTSANRIQATWEESDDPALTPFAFSIDLNTLPLAKSARQVSVNGGSIAISSVQEHVTISDRTLSPL